jgi:hypothetical protein
MPGTRIVVRQRLRGLIPRDTGGFDQPRDALSPDPNPVLESQLGVILGVPYRPRLSSWICLVFSVSRALLTARSDLGSDGDGDAGSDAGREPGDRLRVEAYAPVRGGCASDATNLVGAVKCDLSARRARSLGGPRLASPHRDQHWYSRGR